MLTTGRARSPEARSAPTTRGASPGMERRSTTTGGQACGQMGQQPTIRRGGSTTVEEIKRIGNNRDERRRLAEEARRSRQEETAQLAAQCGGSAPDIDFHRMIKEYRHQCAGALPVRAIDLSDPSGISVCVRKRPMQQHEMISRELDCVTARNPMAIVHERKFRVDGITKCLESHSFEFDRVFDEASSTDEVYHSIAHPLVPWTLDQGGHATLFAYGQTGSGKTYTMVGIQRQLAHHFFEHLSRREGDPLEVAMTFFEIYGDRPYDLLNNRQKLDTLEDGRNEVHIAGLTERPLSSAEAMLQYIDLGNSLRTTHATAINRDSSRSHAVCTVLARRAGAGGGPVHAKITLVDLAGSERAADSRSSIRQRRVEGAQINKSLLALKECVRAMGYPREAHVPFRASKLTLVLRDAFSFTCPSRTVMIACISPGITSADHTVNTLRYSDRLKDRPRKRGSSPSAVPTMEKTVTTRPKSGAVQTTMDPRRSATDARQLARRRSPSPKMSSSAGGAGSSSGAGAGPRPTATGGSTATTTLEDREAGGGPGHGHSQSLSLGDSGSIDDSCFSAKIAWDEGDEGGRGTAARGATGTSSMSMRQSLPRRGRQPTLSSKAGPQRSGVHSSRVAETQPRDSFRGGTGSGPSVPSSSSSHYHHKASGAGAGPVSGTGGPPASSGDPAGSPLHGGASSSSGMRRQPQMQPPQLQPPSRMSPTPTTATTGSNNNNNNNSNALHSTGASLSSEAHHQQDRASQEPSSAAPTTPAEAEAAEGEANDGESDLQQQDNFDNFYLHQTLTTEVSQRGEAWDNSAAVDVGVEDLDDLAHLEALDEVRQWEDRIVQHHMLTLQEDARLLTGESELLSQVQQAGAYDIDRYVQEVDRIAQRKLQLYTTFLEELEVFKELLRQEESLSKNRQRDRGGNPIPERPGGSETQAAPASASSQDLVNRSSHTPR